jgi:hypothetical protein|nr:hypothetical protein [uncultured Oscillibacter sp.]
MEELRKTVMRSQKGAEDRQAPRRWRLNGWTVGRYAFLTAAGILLYKLGTAYALRERGYYAVGGEALALLLPVMYYVAAAVIRDIVKGEGDEI